MKRLLLPLLAVIALPTAVNAEVAEYYLLVKFGKNSWTVPMKRKQLCEDEGLKVAYAPNWFPNEYSSDKTKDGFPYVICVKAK